MKLILSFWLILLACVVGLAAPTVRQAFPASPSQPELRAGLTSINYDGIQVAALAYDATETFFFDEVRNLTLTSRPTTAECSSFVDFYRFIAAEDGAFANYMRQAQTLDVSTAPNTAVFYSGPGNRALAEGFATANGGTTLEMTPGGAWLDQQQLFNTAQSGLTTEQASQVWSTLSQRFAHGASGNAFGFVNGARAGGIFNTVEYPALLNNPNVVNVITGGH